MSTYTREEVIAACPFMESPADLAYWDTQGTARPFHLPRHLGYLNEKLLDVTWRGLRRLICNMPFGHGKTTLCSHYYPAFKLLWKPDFRLILASFEEKFSGKFGAKVKDVLERWGPALGEVFGPQYAIRLRNDSQAKNEWVIESHEGGMVCKGRHGAINGRPADEFLMDDMVKNAEEALSETISEQVWDFYESVVEGRLMPDAPVISVGTRWAKRDWFGRVLERDAERGEGEWEVVKFPAIAEENDVLGRRPGESLWEWRRPLKQLERLRDNKGRWWHPCWQQDPLAEEGRWFHPAKWPRWTDIGQAYSIARDGVARRIYPADDLILIVAADWAFGEKATSDYTAIGVFGLTPGGDLLVLEVVNRRLRPEAFAPEMANVCRRWRPQVVAVEDGHPSFKHDCRGHAEIPEVRWLRPGGKDKLQRALPAILKGQAGCSADVGKNGTGIVLPHVEQPWQKAFVNQIASFTGLDDEHDDQVDCLAWACHVAQDYAGGRSTGQSEPLLLTAPHFAYGIEGG